MGKHDSSEPKMQGAIDHIPLLMDTYDLTITLNG